ncbi:MAG: TerB family tellurite resistance protein [Rhizobiaceae bacterium]
MFQRVMDWLAEAPDGHEPGFGDHDIRVCVAALFYHMVAVDGVITEKERSDLELLLSQRYNLDPTQIQTLASEGEQSDRESAGLFPFTVILNRQMEEHERQLVFDHLQHLAMADGELHELEQSMLNHISVLLKLTQP